MFGYETGAGDVVTSRDEQVAVVALVAAAADMPGRYEWHRVAELIEESGSAVQLIRSGNLGRARYLPDEAALVANVTPEHVASAERVLNDLRDEIGLLTVLDERYPDNLRQIYNRPPFLFFLGELGRPIGRSVAVVGTRNASPSGVEQAALLADGLARAGVTVVSGLARGIDTAAHEATLAAGGRTIAVLGAGIRSKIYPPQNEGLATRILDAGGALVSQFWPTAPPTRWSFPMRNVTMSGMSHGTVVVEANSTSGAKNQAMRAVDHGKRLFLVRDLVLGEEWARKLAARSRLVTVVDSVQDIVDVIDRLDSAPQQLTLS